jgi:hypothetical protein
VRLRRRQFFLGAAALLSIGALGFPLGQRQMVYPTPETESASFHRYRAERAAKPFFAEKQISELAGGESAGAKKL